MRQRVPAREQFQMRQYGLSPRLSRYTQHSKKHRLHLSGMALAEPRDHRVVRLLLGDDEAVAGVTLAQPLDRPARADALRVGVDQQGQQHLRCERRLSGTAELVADLEL